MIFAKSECPFEGPFGHIYFQICPNSGKIFLICNECERIFETPEKLELLEEIDYPTDPLLGIRDFNQEIKEIGCSINETREATKEEIIKFGWEKFMNEE
jgi:hypothetical protein